VDEIAYQPGVGVIHSDGSIKRLLFDTSADEFRDQPEAREGVPLDLGEFIDKLKSLGNESTDFRDLVTQHLKTETIPPETREIIQSALDTND